MEGEQFIAGINCSVQRSLQILETGFEGFVSQKTQAGCGTWRCELDYLETEACWNASAHCQQQSVLQVHHAVASDLDSLAQAKLGS